MFAVVPMSCVTGKRLRQLEVPCLAQEVACEPRRRARGGIERLRRHIASGAPVNDTDRVSAYRRLHGRSRQNKEETMNARALRMLFGAVALSAIAAVLAGGANARPAEGAGVPAEIYSASTSPVVNEHQTPQSGTFLVDPEIYSAFTSPTVLSEQRARLAAGLRGGGGDWSLGGPVTLAEAAALAADERPREARGDWSLGSPVTLAEAAALAADERPREARGDWSLGSPVNLAADTARDQPDGRPRC